MNVPHNMRCVCVCVGTCAHARGPQTEPCSVRWTLAVGALLRQPRTGYLYSGRVRACLFFVSGPECRFISIKLLWLNADY